MEEVIPENFKTPECLSFKIKGSNYTLKNDDKGGYSGGKNYKDNSMLKGESNLWTWERLRKDQIKLKYYEWYYL